jgi:hypothetical protein
MIYFIALNRFLFRAKLKGSCGYWWRLAKATHMEAQAAGVNGDKELRKDLAFSGNISVKVACF